MPYQEKPDEAQIDDTVAVECREPTWVRCSCGYRFFYVEEVGMFVAVAYCPKCRKNVRLMLGMPIALT